MNTSSNVNATAATTTNKPVEVAEPKIPKRRTYSKRNNAETAKESSGEKRQKTTAAEQAPEAYHGQNMLANIDFTHWSDNDFNKPSTTRTTAANATQPGI